MERGGKNEKETARERERERERETKRQRERDKETERETKRGGGEREMRNEKRRQRDLAREKRKRGTLPTKSDGRRASFSGCTIRTDNEGSTESGVKNQREVARGVGALDACVLVSRAK